MDPASLPLRDVHQTPAPPFWPPAPGWWLLALAVLALLAAFWWWRRRKARRRAAIARLFDSAVDAAPTPAAELAALSELLRRAARRIDPAADRLDGEAWLEFLDRHGPAGKKDAPGTDFTRGPGRLLLEGPWRSEVPAAEVARLRPLARARFLAWMGG